MVLWKRKENRKCKRDIENIIIVYAHPEMMTMKEEEKWIVNDTRLVYDMRHRPHTHMPRFIARQQCLIHLILICNVIDILSFFVYFLARVNISFIRIWTFFSIFTSACSTHRLHKSHGEIWNFLFHSSLLVLSCRQQITQFLSTFQVLCWWKCENCTVLKLLSSWKKNHLRLAFHFFIISFRNCTFCARLRWRKLIFFPLFISNFDCKVSRNDEKSFSNSHRGNSAHFSYLFVITTTKFSMTLMKPKKCWIQTSFAHLKWDKRKEQN